MKRIWILALVVILILAIVFVPKLLKNEGDSEVKFKVLEENEIPEDISEILPKYMSEERALSCKVNNNIYVIVTRGEKKTAGYSVTIDKIQKVKKDNKCELIVYAKYKDPSADEIVAQVITYPNVTVKTNLKEIPDKIRLKTEYED